MLGLEPTDKPSKCGLHSYRRFFNSPELAHPNCLLPAHFPAPGRLQLRCRTIAPLVLTIDLDHMPSVMGLDAPCRSLPGDLVQAFGSLLLRISFARLPPPMVLLNPYSARAAFSLRLFVSPLTLDEMRTPVPLLQHAQLVHTRAVASATLPRLYLCRGVDSRLVAVVLQCNAKPRALHPSAV